MEAFSKPELLAILAAARAERSRDWLMIMVTFTHGLRASETVELTRDNFQDGYIVVRRLKGSKKTRQPLLTNTDPLLDERQAIFDYIDGMAGNQKLFPISRQHFWRLMKRYAKSAGVDSSRATCHALKHTIAMQTIHGAGIENTRQWLGHKSLSSTGEYLKVTDEQASEAVQSALGGTPKV